MLAISLWQPWASLLAHGKKRVETRSYPLPKLTEFPTVLAVHAAQKWNNDLRRLARSEPFYSALTALGHGGGRGFCLPFGYVVGLVRVVACVPTPDVRVMQGATAGAEPVYWPSHPKYFSLQISETERAFGDYSPGRWAWFCDMCRPLDTPVACRGHQKFFEWEPTVEARDLVAELAGG